MSNLKLCNLREVFVDTPIYIIELDRKWKDEKEAMLAFRRHYEGLKYLQKKYDDISFIIGLSNKHCVNDEKIQGRGRRKTIVNGKTIDWHLHIAVLGDKCRSFAVERCRRINKKNKESFARAYKLKNGGTRYLHYVYKQSQRVQSKGSFDFSQIEKEDFIDTYPIVELPNGAIVPFYETELASQKFKEIKRPASPIQRAFPYF